MNGILLIDKPQEWTSHDVVAKLRGLLKERRIGHAGTLDPMATGLLTIFVGRATRAAEFAEAEEKTYIARLRLGVVTDTQDITGRVLRECEAEVSQAMLEAVLPRFLGEILQVPPMYSAIKVDGQRLYKLARQGVEVERRARPVTIHRLAVLGRVDGDFELEITCSKGTYIRTLCHDIGEVLGCGGTMSALRRTAVGAFSAADACTLAEIEASDDRAAFLRPLDALFAGYPDLTVDVGQERGIRNGQTVRLDAGHPGRVRVYGVSGAFLALGEVVVSREIVLRMVKRFFEVGV
ncbi:MAG: tRNA pseudouridine(55) synthase TruB [Oscillospiraceae bacterium]|nr:tRNA pseudouridine(55) synthase TruB [Oscillospiraceae bacterium]